MVVFPNKVPIFYLCRVSRLQGGNENKKRGNRGVKKLLFVLHRCSKTTAEFGTMMLNNETLTSPFFRWSWSLSRQSTGRVERCTLYTWCQNHHLSYVIFRLWEETGQAGENPHLHVENMLTQCRNTWSKTQTFMLPFSKHFYPLYSNLKEGVWEKIKCLFYCW